METPEILPASALILSPNDQFKTWLKKAAFKSQVFPVKIDVSVNQDILIDHAMPFVTPILSTEDEFKQFLLTNEEKIFNTLIATWNFPLADWPVENRNPGFTNELFDFSYYLFLLNLIDEKQRGQGDRTTCSLITLKPTTIYKAWYDKLIADKKIAVPELPANLPELDLNIMRTSGVAILAPIFRNDGELQHFIRDHYAVLFDIQLRLYCQDPSLWPANRTPEMFSQWVDCVNYFPVADLFPSESLNSAA